MKKHPKLEARRKSMKERIYPDYLLIKDLPGQKSGCRLKMGSNHIYYISEDPHTPIKYISDKPEETSLLRFNIYTMKSNPDWFLEITPAVERDLKLNKLLKNEESNLHE